MARLLDKNSAIACLVGNCFGMFVAVGTRFDGCKVSKENSDDGGIGDYDFSFSTPSMDFVPILVVTVTANVDVNTSPFVNFGALTMDVVARYST